MEKILELFKSRKWWTLVATMVGAVTAWQALPQSDMTTAALIVGVGAAVSKWIDAQGRVDASAAQRFREG